MRGRRPIPTAVHLIRGTFRWDRHGSRIDAPPRHPPPEPPDDDPEVQRRQREMREQLARIKGA